MIIYPTILLISDHVSEKKVLDDMKSLEKDIPPRQVTGICAVIGKQRFLFAPWKTGIIGGANVLATLVAQ